MVLSYSAVKNFRLWNGFSTSVLTITDCLFADKYLSRKPDSSSLPGDGSRYANPNDNGFIGAVNPFGYHPLPKEESASFSMASESPRILDSRLEASKKSMDSIAELKELVSFHMVKILQFLCSTLAIPPFTCCHSLLPVHDAGPCCSIPNSTTIFCKSRPEERSICTGQLFRFVGN